MKRLKGLPIVFPLAAMAILLMACGNGVPSTTLSTGPEGNSPPSSQVNEPAAVRAAESPMAPAGLQAVSEMKVAPASGGYSTAPPLQVGSAQAGISVTGEGSISLAPNLILLNIGVETMAETVAQARDEAALAMAAIVTSVKSHGLEDKDVQTRSFNIWPRYDYPEVQDKNGNWVRRQVLVGYTVSNSATVKIRDIDNVGNIIDDVAAAGGNATRIDGIQFTVEDPKPYMTSLREAAVKDAIVKAEHFATLTGVQVGGLMFITETGGGTPVVRDFAETAFAMRANAPTTSVSEGELDLSLSVQATFEIR